MQIEESKSLRKIQSANKRSRRKSLNETYYTPLIKRIDTYPDIRINEIANSSQSFENFIHSNRERREIEREIRNHTGLGIHNTNSDDEV